MNARSDSTDSWWWRLLFTPVGPRLVVGRRWPGLPKRRPSAGALIDASALPIGVRELITRVVKRTRLWRGEKAEVARELIAHFEDAISHEDAVDAAVSGFGDATQAAKLIRRAKRRNRPLIWHAWRRTLQAAEGACILTVVLFGVFTIRYYAGKPHVARNLAAEINATIAAIPEDQCGWPLYREALMGLESPGPTSPGGRSILAPADEGWADMVEFLRRHDDVLGLARRAAARPHLGIPLTIDDDAMRRHVAMLSRKPQSSIPPSDPVSEDQLFGWGRELGVTQVRPLTRLLLADAQLAAMETDPRRAQSDLFALIDIASQYRESPMFIADMLSLDVLIAVSRTIGELLTASPEVFSDAQLSGLAHRLSDCSGGGPIRLRYETHRPYFEDMMQRLYTDDGNGDGRLTNAGMSLLRRLGPEVPTLSKDGGAGSLDWLKAPLAAQLIGGRREVAQEFERQLAQIQREAAQPMWEWKMVPGNAFEQQVADEAYYRKYMPLYVLLPAVGRAATQAEVAMMRRDATLTVIALELFRRRYGAYPQTLDQLVPEMMPSVPIDRFDGRPMRYQLSDAGPLLYSIGSDCIDDGGAAAETEYQRLHVPRYTWKIPSPPMHADWILWDGRKHEGDAGAP